MKSSSLLRATAGFASLLLFTSVPLCGQTAEGATTSIVENGDLQSRSGTFFTGWDMGGFLGHSSSTGKEWNNKITAENEADGSPFLRLSCLDPDGGDISASTKEKVAINPAWVSFDVKFEGRFKDYVKGASWGGRAQIELRFMDENDKPVEGEYFVKSPFDNTEWTAVEKSIQIPPGATGVKVFARLVGANGVGDFRKIEVIPN